MLRRLKAELIERRREVRAIKAGYARTYRRNKRDKRVAADVRACVVCQTPLAGKRAGAATCSTRCRVALCRKQSRISSIDADVLQPALLILPPQRSQLSGC